MKDWIKMEGYADHEERIGHVAEMYCDGLHGMGNTDCEANTEEFYEWLTEHDRLLICRAAGWISRNFPGESFIADKLEEAWGVTHNG